MKCKHTECAWSEDCTIIDITKKVPPTSAECSYCKRNKRRAKKDAQLAEAIALKKAKRRRKKKNASVV